MKFKSTILLLFSGIVISFFIGSCTTSNEGQSEKLSVRSKTQRISNRWIVENYTINNEDYTPFVKEYKEVFGETGTFSYTWGLLNGSGSWKFQNNEKEIVLFGTDPQASRTLTVLKIDEDKLWYYFMQGNDKHEIHLMFGIIDSLKQEISDEK